MLIEFSVKNFRSIRDEAHFSMVKDSGKELEESNVLRIADAPAALNPLLRSGVIYGANAAGKNNLLRAMVALQSLVIGSHQRGPSEPLPVTPYLLSSKWRTQPSEFEIHFVVDKVRYQYGVTADQQRIHEEWLYAFPRGKAQKWFQREQASDDQASCIKFSDKLKGEKELWERVTRPNGSLLATAAQLNSEQLTPIYNWFANKLKIAVGTQSWSQQPHFTMSLLEQQQQERVLQFMQAADFAISGLSLKETDGDHLSAITHNMPPPLHDLLSSQLIGSKNVQISTHHQTDEGERIEMDMGDESDGTRKMFCYAGPWMDTLAAGNIMVVDELHDNLHPLLVRYLVEMFHSPELNRHGAQLIFTTHETSILNQALFRRDQVWFCERESNQSTRLYPLSDFAVRKGTENIESGYLSGRYGALPILRAITEEFAQPHGA
ncbi:MAG: ATP-binding protein [Sedimenticola sp.]